ncbi:MAG: mandelate racemase/muconate lactonizing enzyme family protein [Bryobacteraceae bacterium]|nr:mandelate racemase/muconate lactonizing enzyme family protein [Bryobacteraceae bacterium]
MTPYTRRDLLARLPLAALAVPRFAEGRPEPPGKMKITKFVLHKCSLRWRDLMFLEIHTDAGLVGIGEGTCHNRVDVVEAAIRWLEPHMVGQDPAGPEYHWNRNYWELTRWRTGPMLMTALSAVDIALWDLEGKRFGVPVSRLLGGPIHDKLRVYFSHWTNEMKDTSPQAFADRAIETRAKGWTAVKWGVARAPSETERIAEGVARVAAVRKAVGSNFDICLELFESFSARAALRFARAVAPYDVLFIEEPIQREIPDAFRELAAASPVPIATGEGLLSRYEFKLLLDAKGAAIIQPDVVKCGGITELRKIANMAEAYNVEVAPHQPYGPVAHVASLAAASVCRNFVIHEWEADDEALFHELTAGKFPVQKDGVVVLPSAPGLGIDVDFAGFVRRYPYKGQS